MIKINLTQELIQKATNLVDYYGFGHRGFADGNRTEQIVGVCGELAIRELLGLGDLEPKGFDGGYDFNFGDRFVDIKTMGRSVDPEPEFVNNVMAIQMDYKSTHFIFCSLNKKTRVLTICGWATKEDVKQKGEFYAQGMPRKRSDGTSLICKASLYEIKNSVLNRLETVSELKDTFIF